VTMQGLNRQAILVEKGIARSLEPFIAKESNFEKEGYHQAMLDLGTFKNQVYGLPFSVSLPVGYYNMDLLNKAGINKLPETWSEVINSCEKMNEAGVKNPVFWGWNITGNWFMQAMLWSQDVPIIKNGEANFNNAEGLLAMNTMKDIFRSCNMKNLSWKDALASFSAGEIGMMYWSTSALGAVERSQGDFTLKTNEFPGFGAKPKGLPAGGNAAMLVSTSTDPERLDAAWKFLKFITSGVGAAAVAETTGYMPPNKAANEIILANFYKSNPNKETAVRQLPLLREWIAYPGEQGLAITQVIYDALESVVVGDEDDMQAWIDNLSEEVGDMLPKKVAGK
jgi:multiple sugar transport system substrate-binding protein